MSTSTAPTNLTAALQKQSTDNVLQTPVVKGNSAPAQASGTSSTLTIGLVNSTTSSSVNAYLTGLDSNQNSAVWLLESDGVTGYYPANPSAVSTPLAVDCAIPLGAPGTTTNVTIPQIAGGRVWFVIGDTLTFLLNPGSTGPGLAEPSPSNSADPNYLKTWDFCEFTFNTTQLFANISYVDFVSIPVALTLTNTSGTTQHVSGIPSDGLATICSGLQSQNSSDSAGWDGLIITNGGSNLRAVSPNTGYQLGLGLQSTYYDSYVNSVWSYYTSNQLSIDTQVDYGTVSGQVGSDGNLDFGSIGSFAKPSAADIFSCSTGPFATPSTNTDEMLAIIPRLAAAFNRSTLLIDSVQPDNELVSNYYQNSVTNHYSRIVHAANLDNLGYAFPYDDVAPTSGNNVAGTVNDGSPATFLITVGGSDAHTKVRRRRGLEVANSMPVATNFHGKRSVQWDEDLARTAGNQDRDLEYGQHPKLLNEFEHSDPAELRLPPFLERIFGKYLAKIRAMPYASRLRPVFDIINAFLVSFLSLSMRAILSRVFLLVLVLVVYLFGGYLPHGNAQVQGGMPADNVLVDTVNTQ
ncbi:MAG: hypothetical protein M1818_007716 [Claussenomyces sp. TS43310]|nr:MAG: hypothetical protein M1818_007716 [Claussenomyces sp. TS43310]